MRKFFATVLLLGVAFPAIQSIRADEASQQLLDRAIQAHGGPRELAKAKTLVRAIKGEITSFGGNIPATVELTAQLPGQTRWIFELDAGTTKTLVTIVINGDKGWRSAGGAVKELSKPELEEQRGDGLVLYLTTLLPLKEAGYELTAIPEVKVAGEPAAGLKATRKGESEVKLYFDKKTGLLVKVERKAREAGVDVTKEYLFSDFKDFEGLKLPTKQLELANGKKVADWTVKDWKFPGRIEEKQFGKP